MAKTCAECGEKISLWSDYGFKTKDGEPLCKECYHKAMQEFKQKHEEEKQRHQVSEEVKTRCPICKSNNLVKASWWGYKCLVCSAHLRGDGSVAKAGIVIWLDILSVLVTIAGVLLGLLTLSIWVSQKTYNHELFIAAAVIIVFFLAIGAALSALSKIVFNSDIQTYCAKAQAKSISKLSDKDEGGE